MKTKTRRTSKKSAHDNLEAQLARLEAAQLVNREPDEEPSYIFKHALTQEATYESLLLRQRRAIHRRVGEMYERLYPNRLDDFAAQLAQHFAQAGDDAKTLGYSIRAGDVAMRVYASSEAIAHYNRALQVGDGGSVPAEQLRHIFMGRGRAFELAGQFDRALANYSELGERAVARGDRALELVALMSSATVYAVGGHSTDLGKAQAASMEALGLARDLGDREAEAKIYWNLLLLNRFGNEGPRKAVEYGEQSIAIARELGLREQLALSLLDIVNAYGAIGQFERAVATGEEALALRRELGNQPILAENLAIVAFGRLAVGDLARARELGEESYSIGHSLRNNYGLTISAGFLALVYRELGDIERYLDLAAEAVRSGEESGLDRLENFTRIERVWTVGAMGDLQRGFELGTETLASVEAKSPSFRPWCVGALVRLHLLNGDLRAAEALLAEIPLASFEEYLSVLMLDAAGEQIVFAHAEFAMAKGDFARAIGILDDLIGWIQRTAARIQLPSALHLKAKVLLGRERFQEARVLLLDARRQAEGVQARFRLWPILATLSQVEEQLGNATQARATRAEARGAIEYVAKHTPADLRDKFVNMPDVRAVLGE